MKIVNALLFAVLAQVHALKFAYGDSTRSRQSSNADTTLLRKRHEGKQSESQYDIIRHDLPPLRLQDTKALDIASSILDSRAPAKGRRDANGLKRMLDLLTSARSDAFGQRGSVESAVRTLGRNTLGGSEVSSLRRRGRDGSRNRGGKRRGGRWGGRRNGRKRGGRRRHSMGKRESRRRSTSRTNSGKDRSRIQRLIRNRLRWKRSSSQEAPYQFNEQGVFGGLQQLPFNQDQFLQFVPLKDDFVIDRSLSNDRTVDLSLLPAETINSPVSLLEEYLGGNGSSVDSKNETVFDNGVTEVPDPVLVTTKIGRSRRRGQNRGRSQDKRRPGKNDRSLTEEGSNPVSQIGDAIVVTTLEPGKVKNRKLGRGKERGARRGDNNNDNNSNNNADNSNNNAENSNNNADNNNSDTGRRGVLGGRRRGGRRGKEGEGGRRRGGRRGDKASPSLPVSAPASISVTDHVTNGADATDVTTIIGAGRQRRAIPKDGGFQNMLGSFTIPKGKLFKWTRNMGGINVVNEFAFASTEKNVAVVMSFDPKLRELGFTNGATLYDFTGHRGIVALRPRVTSSPCYLIETSHTFEEIVAELDERNSTSVATNTIIALDGSGNPISKEEHQALLQQTPSLRRQCRGRSIVRATPYGMAPVAHSGTTYDLKVLTLDNEVTLTVREQPPSPTKVGESPFSGFRVSRLRPWGRLRSMLGRGGGRLAQWMGQGRWGRDQGTSSSTNGRPKGMQIGNQTVTLVPSAGPGPGMWPTSF